MSKSERLRIFIVEDEMMVVLDLEDMIMEMGHVVAATATRMEAAMAHATGSDFDLAILDVNVAGRMSFPVAEVLRARGIPFIFATGYGVSALPQELRGHPTLQKPFRMADLEREVGIQASARARAASREEAGKPGGTEPAPTLRL